MRCFVLGVSLSLLVACSGGGGGSSSPNPSGNSAPVFTSAATATVSENESGTIYTATATDADGNALTFSLTSSPDQNQFSITSGGALSFVSPPDFELPTDANTDNIYNVTIQVSDRTTTRNLTLDITITDLTEEVQVRRVGTGFSQPLFALGTRDGTGRIFVLEKGGRVRILDPATGVIDPTNFLDLSGTISTDSERGLLGMALAPDYETSGIFYVSVTNVSGDTEIRRYERSGVDPDQADPSTLDVILTIDQPASNHNGGWIDFGLDGFLYISSGDGGGSNDPFENGQDPSTTLGAMLRIDVSSDDFRSDDLRDYAIPDDNPFASGGGAPEIWAYGLRNPFRASFDTATGHLFIGDVGQGAIEEIDIILSGEAGLNFGWDDVEGTRNNEGTASATFTLPVTEYGHGGGDFQGNSVTGGYVYRGPVEAYQGRYIFADFISDNIWAMPAATLVDNRTMGLTSPSTEFTLLNTEFTPDQGSLGSIASFGTDDAENLYIISIAGSVFRMDAAD